MQSVVAFVSRRRKALALAAVIAGGGYASYRYSQSESFLKRKRQVILLIHALGKLCETMASVSDSAALVSEDFNHFLRAEGNEVPQSMRQLFKILCCEESQNLLVASSARICKEVIFSPAAPSRNKSKAQVRSSTSESEGWRARERVIDLEPDMLYFRGGASSSRSSSRSSRRQEDLPERLLNKLFGEAGRGFASAVVGAAVRNLVVTFFEENGRRSGSNGFNSRDLIPETYELGASGVVRPPVWEAQGWQPEALFNLACTNQGKSLITDCIRQFVEASVSTYLEKTRDVNVFEEMVGAVTHPVHQQPAKEVIVTVCNEAISTLVRTSYDVFQDSSPSSFSRQEAATSPRASASDPVTGLQRGAENTIEKLFRTLTVPSNRALVIDLAGKVTSEAIRSFFSVMITLCGPYIRSSKHVVHSKVVVVQKRMTGDAASKVLTLMTVCFAVMLHVLAGGTR